MIRYNRSLLLALRTTERAAACLIYDFYTDARYFNTHAFLSRRRSEALTSVLWREVTVKNSRWQRVECRLQKGTKYSLSGTIEYLAQGETVKTVDAEGELRLIQFERGRSNQSWTKVLRLESVTFTLRDRNLFATVAKYWTPDDFNQDSLRLMKMSEGKIVVGTISLSE